MSRRATIIRNIAIGLAAFILLAVVVVLLIVRSNRFQEYVKQKVITAIAEGTGGVTEVGTFGLDLTHMHARITNLVIHGSEPAGSAPFVRVAQVDVNARLFGGGNIIGISYLGIQRPELNVMVFPDGRTNLPTPKPSAPSKNTPLETVVDLAVGHLDLTGGQLTLNSQKQPLDVRANNLRAQLWYRLVQHDYEGQLSLDPIYVVSGRNTPVTYRVTMPVVLERDRIRLHDATIATPTSTIQIDAAMENMRDPAFSGHIRGRLTLADLQNTLNVPLETSRRGLPNAIDLDANATMSANVMRVSNLRVALGQSQVEASGVLKDPHGGGPLKFNAQLALPELARLLRASTRPEGTIFASGEAKLAAGNQYEVSGQIHSRGLGIEQGTMRLRNVELSTGLELTPDRVELRGLRLAALGGEFAGNATLQQFAHYTVEGSLRHFDIEALAQLAGQKLPYSGSISGPVKATGDVHAPGTQGIDANANLTIAPGRRGIPVQGRIQAEYNGSRDDVALQNTFLALPHTRLTLAGSVQRGLDVSLTTRDLHDLLAATPNAGSAPVVLAGGQASFTGRVTGKLAAPHISGHLAANRFAVEGRQFDALAADVNASPAGAAVNNGSLARGPMQAAFSASVGMRSWKPGPQQPLTADVTVQNGDLADIMVLAGQPNQEFSGALTAALHVNGTVGNPRGSATVHAANGTLEGEPFDRIDLQASFTDQLATIQQASLVAGNAHADLTAQFQHPRDSFTTGTVHATLRTNQIDLAQFRNLQKQLPDSSGQLQLSADVAGSLSQVREGGQEKTEFLVSNVNADASAHALRFQGQQYGDLQANARTSGQTANLDLTSNFAGSNLHVRGTAQLVHDYPATADVQWTGLPVERVLALAHRDDIPVRGNLSLDAHVHGTLQSPEGDATLTLAKAVVSDEPLDRVQAHITYQPQRIDVSQFEVKAGPSHVALSAQFDHPAGHLDEGNLQFRLENSQIDLAHLKNVQKLRPGVGGTLQLAGDGAATLRPSSQVLLTNLNANITGNQIAAQGKNLGDFSLAAHTTSGNRLDFNLNSNMAGATIQAKGNGQLSGDYPVDAQLTFNNVKWTRLQPLLGTAGTEPPSFEVTAEGSATVRGPIRQTDALQGSLQIARLQLDTLPKPGLTRTITIQNQGTMQATLDRGVVHLTNFHLSGPQTDIQVSGTAGLLGQNQNLRVTVNGGVDLAVLKNFSRDIVASGNIKLAADVRGTLSDPQTTGNIELHDASLNYAGVSNGLSNANGVIALRGNRASIQNLSGESGGGKITLSGFATLNGNHRFVLRANADRVRVPIQQGVKIVIGGDVRLAGTEQSSTATGSVTLQELTYAPHSDLGSMLTRAAPPVQSSEAPSPLLENMRLDVRVRTSPATRIQVSLGENLQTDVDLQIRGTASQPAVLGRIELTSGKLEFFGSTYTVNTGTISFYNPTRIEPILNISLETQSKGVDVVLNVTGPVDNMKLTYTSDPPLQFSEIVALLSTGTTPTSDPTILANQPTPPPQSFEQMGESAIVGQAVANPVASRLQRVFGVSQLKIDPTFSGSSALPTAQVTLQQQVSTNITFTYVSDLQNPNSTLISAQFALNPRWSALAVRDQNGIVSINLLYKKQFR